MPAILITISILIVLTGVAIRFSSSTLDIQNRDSEFDRVLSAQDRTDKVDDDTYEKESKEYPSPVSTFTPIPTQPKATDNSQPASTLNDYKYPNSETIGSTRNSLTMVSSDSPDQVTAWYKEKIKAIGANVKSFVQTSANNNVSNKLVASSSEVEINVDITRSANQTSTQIFVSLN